MKSYLKYTHRHTNKTKLKKDFKVEEKQYSKKVNGWNFLTDTLKFKKNGKFENSFVPKHSTIKLEVTMDRAFKGKKQRRKKQRQN